VENQRVNKIVTVVGARPQFVKAATISRVVRQTSGLTEVLVHTGQHYDANMSQVFFDELDIPRPNYQLGIGSGSHGAQTGRMLEAIEAVLLAECPDALLVYGDTNSTLAGALAACKLHIPVGHVEAGLRSFDRRMPEELNRLLTDHVSHWLFCPTQVAVDNLVAEGVVTRGDAAVHCVGDVMYDALLFSRELAARGPSVLAELGLAPKGYYLATVHRAANTDDPSRLASILAAFGQLGYPVVLPLHPRTRGAMAQAGIAAPATVRPIEPVGYLEMLQLEQGARAILTDSGGVQKEAYLLAVPCITLREETEWVETVTAGWNHLVGADTARIVAVARSLTLPAAHLALYGDGRAAEQIVHLLMEG
jgi:UDP-N-acetylglucosamine 2-epimerase (non-hydrolysing)/UDP-GlcNAc3NAcA epimerase